MGKVHVHLLILSTIVRTDLAPEIEGILYDPHISKCVKPKDKTNLVTLDRKGK